MKILLINPPYQTLTSNYGVGHQIPLGLLMIGGPLLDAGRQVRLLDAEARRLKTAEILAAIAECRPDVVMTGHVRPCCRQRGLRSSEKSVCGTAPTC